MDQQFPGAVVAQNNGFELRLIPNKTSYKSGEMPILKALFKNISTKPIIVCTYLAKHRLLCNMMAGDYELLVFTPTPTLPITNADFKTFKPGEEAAITLDVNGEPGYGFVYGGGMPPIVPEEMAIKGFPAGEYTFQAHFGSFVSYFDASKGTFNHKKKRVHILKEAPKSGVTVNLSSVWDGELVAKIPLKFI